MLSLKAKILGELKLFKNIFKFKRVKNEFWIQTLDTNLAILRREATVNGNRDPYGI